MIEVSKPEFFSELRRISTDQQKREEFFLFLFQIFGHVLKNLIEKKSQVECNLQKLSQIEEGKEDGHCNVKFKIMLFFFSSNFI